MIWKILSDDYDVNNQPCVQGIAMEIDASTCETVGEGNQASHFNQTSRL
jgi:hypothetical protein